MALNSTAAMESSYLRFGVVVWGMLSFYILIGPVDTAVQKDSSLVFKGFIYCMLKGSNGQHLKEPPLLYGIL